MNSDSTIKCEEQSVERKSENNSQGQSAEDSRDAVYIFPVGVRRSVANRMKPRRRLFNGVLVSPAVTEINIITIITDNLCLAATIK